MYAQRFCYLQNFPHLQAKCTDYEVCVHYAPQLFSQTRCARKWFSISCAQKGNEQGVWDGKHVRISLLGRTKRKWDNIKMDLKEIKWVWPEFIWVRIRTVDACIHGNKPLCSTTTIIIFINCNLVSPAGSENHPVAMGGISLLANNLSSSQKGIYFIKLTETDGESDFKTGPTRLRTLPKICSWNEWCHRSKRKKRFPGGIKTRTTNWGNCKYNTLLLLLLLLLFYQFFPVVLHICGLSLK